jgi:hypothetical protein
MLYTELAEKWKYVDIIVYGNADNPRVSMTNHYNFDDPDTNVFCTNSNTRSAVPLR